MLMRPIAIVAYLCRHNSFSGVTVIDMFLRSRNYKSAGDYKIAGILLKKGSRVFCKADSGFSRIATFWEQMQAEWNRRGLQ